MIKICFFFLSRAATKLTDLELRWPHGFTHPQINHVVLIYLFLNSDEELIFSFWKLLNIIPFSFVPMWITVLKNLTHKVMVNVYSDNTEAEHNRFLLYNLNWSFSLAFLHGFFWDWGGFLFVCLGAGGLFFDLVWVFFPYSFNVKTNGNFGQYGYCGSAHRYIKILLLLFFVFWIFLVLPVV